MIMQLMWEGIIRSWRVLDKYETPMLKYVVETCRFHICDMFEEMLIMVGLG